VGASLKERKLAILKTPGSKMGSPAAAEGGGEAKGGERGKLEREGECDGGRRES